MKKVKIITIILAIVLVSLVAFGGVYIQTQNRMEDKVKEYSLGRELNGERVVEIKVTDGSKEGKTKPSDEELTVENVRHNSRFHKRCGTSFLVIVMLVSIILFFFIRTDVLWLRVLSRIILVPAIAGISYEFIRYAGKHDNLLVNIISAPGIAMQIITTSEPDDSMIEVAIASLNAVLEEEPEENANS